MDEERSRNERRMIRLWRHQAEGSGWFRRLWPYTLGALFLWVFLELSARSQLSGVAITVVLFLFMLGLFLFDTIAMRSERLRRPGRLPFILRKWRIWSRPGTLVCPYCRDLLLDAEVDPCDECGTGYHTDCRGELLGSCGTLGCVNQGRLVQAGDTLKLKL